MRVDPMPRFEGNLSLMVHAPFVGWPARMGPMDDPEPVAGEVVFSDPGCAICRPATIERPEISASLRFPAFTVDYAEIDEQTLRPGFGCDLGWVDLQLDANPDGELVRQVGVMLEGSPDLGTLSGGVLVFDELLPF